MVARKQKRRRRKEEFKFEDFRKILELPERLAVFLREWLHIDKVTWDFCLDRIRQHKAGQRPAYKEWSKSKGPGKGRRYFAAPCSELKVIQKAILDRILASTPVHCARHGNQRGSSIISNALRHSGFAKAIFSVDIVNAFPTVFRSRIKANLKKPFWFGLRQFAGVEFSAEDKEMMLESLADLLAYHDRLPQGPPTSPRILDIVCMKMDTAIYALLAQNTTPFQEYRFTAWADDLTISTNGAEIPVELREGILKIIRENGFIPHTRADKTVYYSPETGKVPMVT